MAVQKLLQFQDNSTICDNKKLGSSYLAHIDRIAHHGFEIAQIDYILLASASAVQV